ncbi:MAG: hypothetical protein Q8M80_17025, partial [Hydrogenophaga sp.]|nr:hypothetical protein [Hydrogenophaga sp.]
MHTLTPAHLMPWTVASPFRMRPGLSRLARPAAPTAAPPPPLFLRDAQAPAYAAHKQAVLHAHRERAWLGHTEPAVLQAIATAYAAQTGVALAPTAEALTLGL